MRILSAYLVSAFVMLSFSGHLSAQQSQVTLAQVKAPPSGSAASPVPYLIRFTGTLLDRQGQPLKGPVAVTFSLYAQQSGDAPLWMETQNVELDAKGGYTTLLGANSGTGLPEQLFRNGEARWLGVQPEREPELPRVLLVSVPYALKAGDAQTLGGLPPSAFAPANLSSSSNAASAPSVSAILLATPGGQPQAGGATTAPTGGGVTNFIPLWTSSANLGNSILFQSSSSNVNVNGSLSMPPLKPATSQAGANSQPLDLMGSSFNKTIATAVNQHFRWQAEPVGNNTSSPSGRLSLLFAAGAATPAETGLSIGNNGIISFASGQPFPTVTGNETVSGNVSAKQLISTVATGMSPFSVSSRTQVLNLNASFLGGLSASSFATLGANHFIGNQSVNGNVGIGTTAPTERLDLGNAGNVVIKTDPGSDTAEGNVGYKLIGRDTGGAAHTWAMYTAPVGGGFGIPANSLSFWEYSSSAAGCCLQRFVILPVSPTAKQLGLTPVIDGFGRVGIGTSTPSVPLHVAAVPFLGNSAAIFEGPVDITGDLSVSGCIFASGGATLGSSCPSDARLKKNIQPFSAILDKLAQLQPVSYNWRVEEFPQFHFGTSRTSGLIAQEVEKVFPEMVSIDADGFRRVNYSELPLLMLQAIRELKAEKDKLQEELKTKEGQWEERFRDQEKRASLQQVQQLAAFEARLIRLESEGRSNQTAAATREVPKKNTAAVD